MGEAFFVKAAKGAMERTSGRVGSHKASVSISCERSVTNFATNTACRRKLPPLLTCLRGRSSGTNQFRIQASRKKDEEVNGGGLNSNLEVAVPAEQRPVNELTALREGPLSGWAGLELPSFIQRLGLVWLTGFFFSCPIAAGSYSPDKDVAEFLLSAGRDPPPDCRCGENLHELVLCSQALAQRCHRIRRDGLVRWSDFSQASRGACERPAVGYV